MSFHDTRRDMPRVIAELSTAIRQRGFYGELREIDIDVDAP